MSNMINFEGFIYTGGKAASDEDVKLMQDLYDAICISETWDFVKADPGDGGFMLCRNPELNKIVMNMKHFEDHSGATFASLLRFMQYIAREGEDRIKERHFIH